ncbi:hypothetical protein DLREEDagrD3_24600 [Denitratisoma sp. agr-D3]
MSATETRDDTPLDIRCPRCLHYYITFDPGFPYGCRALGFKSRTAPEREVVAASGMSCQCFTEKPPARRR